MANNSARTYTPHAGRVPARPYVSKANSLKLLLLLLVLLLLSLLLLLLLLLTYRPPWGGRSGVYIYIYIYIFGEGCVALLLFVNEAHWRRRNEKQNRSNRDQQSRAFAEHSQSIRRAFAEHSQSIRRAFAEHSQRFRGRGSFFFEKLKTRNLVKIIWKCMRILTIFRPEILLKSSRNASEY